MDNKTDRIIYLLLGQKGSGKTFIGGFFYKEFQIKFLRVEDWAKEVKKERQIDQADYLDEVFKVIENGVRNSLRTYSEVVFESTGLTDQFDSMLTSLRKDFKVVTIAIQTDSKLCLNRVKTRDQSIHINVSDDQVNTINQQVILKSRETDYIIQNTNSTYDELVHEISKILTHERSPNR